MHTHTHIHQTQLHSQSCTNFTLTHTHIILQVALLASATTPSFTYVSEQSGLQLFTGDYWRLLGITRDYWRLLEITGQYWITAIHTKVLQLLPPRLPTCLSGLASSSFHGAEVWAVCRGTLASEVSPPSPQLCSSLA